MNKIIFLFLVLAGLTVQSQSYGVMEKGFGIVHLERHQFKFDLFSPGISYELGIIKNVSASGGLGLGYATYEEGYAVGVTLHTRVRYYHNFNRRIAMDKNVSGNSGDYIAAARSIFFSQVRLAT